MTSARNQNVQAGPCFYLNIGYNNPSSAVKMIKASTGGIYYTSDIVWTVLHTTVLSLPAPDVVGGSGYTAAPTTPLTISNVPAPPAFQQ